MELYFHHVGQAGSDEDFPKTFFTDVDLARIEAAIPPEDPLRKVLVRTLRTQFPNHSCNCWGVPIGARWPIAHLKHGDAVLLVEAVTAYGRVPAFCPNVAYWNRPYHALSTELWGNPRNPCVFFFQTESLDLTWHEMRADLGYSPAWVPRNFFRITPVRLAPFGGRIRRLRHMHGHQLSPFAPVAPEDRHELEENSEGIVFGEVNRELAVLEARVGQQPQLTEGLDLRLSHTLRRSRTAAFRLAVRRAYGDRCAICGSALRSPTGAPEVQSAHIYPKQLDGRDDVRNGLCLCRPHHWAFDVGWMTITDDYTVLIRDDLPEHSDFDFIQRFEGKKVSSPVDANLAPHPLFLRRQRSLRGFP